jgi:hypothetical protein
MTPQKKNIIIISSIIGGSVLFGIIIYSVTVGKKRKLEAELALDKEMKDLMAKIEKAPK